MKSTILLIAGLLSGLTFSSYGQSLIIAKDASLPKDTVTKNELINSLNGFLDQKDGPSKNNKYVLKEDLLAMSALLDELKGMDKNIKLKDDHFYKAYLTNTVNVDNNDFLIQLAYMGMAENLPILRASFKLMAKNGEWAVLTLYSVLKQHTIAWKTKKISNITYHFKDTLDAATAKDYLKTVNSFDKRLKVPATPFEFYFCDNFPEALQILGVEYKSNYSGIKYDDITSHENDMTLELDGGYTETKRFDAHDLWHDRLHKVMSVDVINRPVG